MANDEQTPEYAEAMNEAIAAATRAEDERDAAQAEVASLKRKYEPEDGVVIDKLLKLEYDDYQERYMRVQVLTGERLRLQLVRRPRAPSMNLEFRPAVQGLRDDVTEFDVYGVYDVCIASPTDGGYLAYSCVVRFDVTGVRITSMSLRDEDGSGMEIEEVTTTTVVLTMGDDA